MSISWALLAFRKALSISLPCPWESLPAYVLLQNSCFLSDQTLNHVKNMMLVSETLVVSGFMYWACLHLLKSQAWFNASTGKPIKVIQQCAVQINDGMTNAFGKLHQTICSLRIN